MICTRDYGDAVSTVAYTTMTAVVNCQRQSQCMYQLKTTKATELRSQFLRICLQTFMRASVRVKLWLWDMKQKQNKKVKYNMT